VVEAISDRDELAAFEVSLHDWSDVTESPPVLIPLVLASRVCRSDVLRAFLDVAAALLVFLPTAARAGSIDRNPGHRLLPFR
jgi:hypothetical protein